MLPERIKKRRKDLGLTQNQLADLINSRKSTISNYETGYSAPSGEVLKDLATALKTSVDYLLGRTDDQDPLIVSESNEKYLLQALNAANHFNYVKEPGAEYVPINVREAVLETLNQRNMIVHGSPQTNHIPNKTEIILRATLLEAAVSWSREEIMAALTAVQAWRTTKKDIEDATKGLDEEE